MLFFGEMRYGSRSRISLGVLTGNQIEYLVVAFDDEQKKVRLSLCQADVLTALARDEELAKKGPVVPELQDW